MEDGGVGVGLVGPAEEGLVFAARGYVIRRLY